MQVLRSFLAGGLMLASVGIASAAEPSVLTEEQLDGVSAGGCCGGVFVFAPFQQAQVLDSRVFFFPFDF